MSLLEYIQQELTIDVATYLNSLSNDEDGFPKVKQYYSPDSDWFYKGTVRAVLFKLLSKWITENTPLGEYLLLVEQPYLMYPIEQPIDIVIVAKNGDLIFFDVIANFNLSNVEDSISKLQQAYAEMKSLKYGFAMYFVEEVQANDSAKILESYQSDNVKALGIVKQ